MVEADIGRGRSGRARVAGLVATATLLLAAAACGGGSNAHGSGQAGAKPSPTSSTASESRHATNASDTDPCTLLRTTQVNQAFEASFTAPTKPYSFVCQWDDAPGANGESADTFRLSLYGDEPYEGAFDDGVPPLSGIGESAQFGMSQADLVLRVKEPWGYLQETLAGALISGGTGIDFDPDVQRQKVADAREPMKSLAEAALGKLDG